MSLVVLPKDGIISVMINECILTKTTVDDDHGSESVLLLAAAPLLNSI